jgi:hypothetical protein
MKKIKSKNYLVISSAHLGMDDDILKIFANVAKENKAEVIHLGPLATDEEIKNYSKLKKNIEALDSSLFYAQTDRQEETISEKLQNAKDEFGKLCYKQEERIGLLEIAFGKVKFVTTPDMMLPRNKDNIIKEGIELSKYLYLSPIPPRGMKASGGAITPASMAYLTDLGKSWIVAHPIPEVQCLPKPNLNESHSYFTVGALKHTNSPTHTKNQFAYSHMPACILVSVNVINDEFHAQALHVDYLDNKKGKKLEAMVLDDGRVFTTKGVSEVKSADKATFSTDFHAPHQHNGVVASMRGLNILHEPETLIDGGDLCEFGSVSHWLEGKPGAQEGLRLKDELTSMRELMIAICNVPSIKKRVLIDSNHHEWLSQFIDKNPSLIGICDWKTLANEMFSDWEIILRTAGENKLYVWGKILIRHGDKDGGARGKFKNYKYLSGHFHKFVSYRRSIQSQLAVLTKFKEIGSVSVKIILHDKERDVSRFAYRGQIYEVAFYDVKW